MSSRLKYLALTFLGVVAAFFGATTCGSSEPQTPDWPPLTADELVAMDEPVPPPKPGVPLPRYSPPSDAMSLNQGVALAEFVSKPGAPLPAPTSPSFYVADIPSVVIGGSPLPKVLSAPAPALIPAPVMAPASCTAVADVAIVGGDVNDLREQFAGLVDKVAMLGEQAKRTETDIVEVKTRVGTSDAKVLELTSRLAQVETSVGQLAPRISQVEEQARDAVARLGKLEQSPSVQPVVLSASSSMPETLLQGMIRNWQAESPVAEAYARTFVRKNAGTSAESLMGELKMAAKEAKLDENSTEEFVKWAKVYIPAPSAAPDGASK